MTDAKSPSSSDSSDSSMGGYDSETSVHTLMPTAHGSPDESDMTDTVASNVYPNAECTLKNSVFFNVKIVDYEMMDEQCKGWKTILFRWKNEADLSAIRESNCFNDYFLINHPNELDAAVSAYVGKCVNVDFMLPAKKFYLDHSDMCIYSFGVGYKYIQIA